MKIVDHRLYHDNGEPYPYQETPNKRGVIKPRYLVMHYTAGSSAASAIRTLTSSRARASAHIVIGRDGKITQLAPFNIKTWHAGKSRWKELKSLNSHSIGIEIDNAGPLTKVADGWKTWFNKTLDSSEGIEAIHKLQKRSKGWQIYPEQQLDALMELSELLVTEYQLEDILGHEDIAPKRKQDPGPAFPMEEIKARVFGRGDEDEQEITYEVVPEDGLNLRSGPGTRYDKLEGSPLPKGTRLEVVGVYERWCEVEVLDVVNGEMDLEGWVGSRHIKRV
ncbi:N-acetylmuramoyl-L-alanine amidase [Candidatus Parabeggiatoa sp. HSG14]|uniref:N-acetylmuramoyl-L-alanine amidase n=1 Tax=Candidatus Parabeggiatoa sp. HSG14 TaxID=3055593 RepID=UPI0025A6B342|nr:N-acetylmuramoyl-L-alanine amidase [Thiotrichales bacterium HSG14]